MAFLSALLFGSAPWLAAPAQAAFPGDGNGRLAFVRDGDVYTANPDGSGVVKTRVTPLVSLAPAWSATGAKIVYCSSPGIFTMNSDGSDRKFVTGANCESFDGPSWSHDGSKILFASDPGGQEDIFVVNPDGTGLTNLTNSSDYDSTPVWSPDGLKIAFASGPQSFDQDIYTMNPDGTGQALVTDGIGSNDEPNWSPAGDRIAFSSDRDCILCDTRNIYSIKPDGTDLLRLTTSATYDRSPAYSTDPDSPDGLKIAYESCDPLNCTQTIQVMNADGTNPTPVTEGMNPDWGVPSPPFDPPPADGRIAYSSPQDHIVSNRDEIYSMYADGYRQTRLTTNQRGDHDPAWSWDGGTLAFVSRADGDDWEIYSMPADGHLLPVNLTNDPAQDVQPTWSPVTDQIAFASDRGQGSTTGIYVMNTDGTNPSEITDPPEEVFHGSPAWSPDGGKIAFVSNEDGDDDIYIMNPDGTGIENVSNTSGVDELAPAWSPGGQQIAYIRADEGGQVWTMRRTGSEQSALSPGSLNADSPTWSRTGATIAFAAEADIYAINTDGTGLTNLTATPLWGEYDPASQPPSLSQTVPGYARPRAATPATIRLVPAFEECSAPNAEHGSPLVAPSCNPPVPASDYLTIGIPPEDPAESIGTVTLKVFCTDAVPLPCASSPGEQIDVQVTASITDVRMQADGSDYTGELRLSLTNRITDRYNTPALTSPATVMDTSLGFPLACSATSEETVGSTCSTSTTADAILPGLTRELKRAIWQLGAIEVYDGGSDGDADTVGDNTLFAVQGLFTP